MSYQAAATEERARGTGRRGFCLIALSTTLLRGVPKPIAALSIPGSAPKAPRVLPSVSVGAAVSVACFRAPALVEMHASVISDEIWMAFLSSLFFGEQAQPFPW